MIHDILYFCVQGIALDCINWVRGRASSLWHVSSKVLLWNK